MLGVEQPAQRTFLGGAGADSGAGVFRALGLGVFLREGSLTRRRGFAVGAGGGMFGTVKLKIREVNVSSGQVCRSSASKSFMVDAAVMGAAK
jgi:hypothetical protein